jgi:DNA-binding response OmpR family regulator
MTTIFRKVMQKRHTILIIEDEDILRQMLYDVFSEANFHVLCAVDGEDGLAQFQAHYPNIDFVVLDMNMPNLNGEHVCKVLSEQYSKLPPIIVTTGYVADDVVQRLYLYGIHDFVMKPYDVDMLLQQVCEIWNLHRHALRFLKHEALRKSGCAYYRRFSWHRQGQLR